MYWFVSHRIQPNWPLFFLKNEKASKNFASLKCHSTELQFALSLENLLYIVSSLFSWFNWWSTVLSHTIKSLGENHGHLRTRNEKHFGSIWKRRKSQWQTYLLADLVGLMILLQSNQLIQLKKSYLAQNKDCELLLCSLYIYTL